MVAPADFSYLPWSFQLPDLEEYLLPAAQNPGQPKRLILSLEYQSAARQLRRLVSDNPGAQPAAARFAPQGKNLAPSAALPSKRPKPILDLILPTSEFSWHRPGFTSTYQPPGVREGKPEELELFATYVPNLLSKLAGKNGLAVLSTLSERYYLRAYSLSQLPMLGSSSVAAMIAAFHPQIAQQIQTTWTKLLREAPCYACLDLGLSIPATSPTQNTLKQPDQTGPLSTAGQGAPLLPNTALHSPSPGTTDQDYPPNPSRPPQLKATKKPAFLAGGRISTPAKIGLGSIPWGSGGFGLACLLAELGIPLLPGSKLVPLPALDQYDLIITNTDRLAPWSLSGSPLAELLRACDHLVPIVGLASRLSLSKRELHDWGLDAGYQVAENLNAWRSAGVRQARTWSH